ncbi:hypothetical protein ACHAXS_002644 [Conticribra weissflogii]
MNLLASMIDVWTSRIYDFLTLLDLPSREQYISAAASALHDFKVASSSSWHLAYLTFRPLVILLGILSHNVAVILRVIAQHSVAHGWIAAKEGYFQLKTATIWFVNFQRELPTSAKYAELGAVGILIALWLLRRHVRKRRYVERTMAWYREKKRRALRRYRRMVEKVAKTSLLLALMLPHLFYIVAAIIAKRMVPSVVTYLATRTYLNAILSFWHPLYLTISAISSLSNHLKAYEKIDADGDKPVKSSKISGRKPGKEGRQESLVTPSVLRKQQKQETDMKALRSDVEDLLKYWVVYALLVALFRTLRLLPIVGRFLNITASTTSTIDSTAQPANTGRWFTGRKAGLFETYRSLATLAEELRLAFFVWLRLIPMPTFSASEASDGKRSGKVLEVEPNQHRPLDISYDLLSPFPVSAMNSSAFLTKTKPLSGSRKDDNSYFAMAIEKLRSILYLAVMLRLCSKNFQDWIISTVVESSSLVPAAVTLVMPSYFTSYGVIYVSLIVPAGYSSKSCAAIKRQKPSSDLDTLPFDESRRYLQFWVVHAMITVFLDFMTPLLSWVPFSTHMIWILWAYAQLEHPTRRLYSFLEKELALLGLIHSKDDQHANITVNDSAVVRSVRKFISALPSNVE